MAEFRALTPARYPVAEHRRLRRITLSLLVLVLALLRVWPAYERFYRQGGRRSVFVLDPTTAVEPQPAEQLTP